MNRIRRTILVIGAVVCILTISGTVAAINDDTGDVWHYKETNGGWSWDKYSGEKPNIDITDVSQSTNGNETTLTMKVNGEIENSENIEYWMYLKNDNSDYYAHYSNKNGTVGGNTPSGIFSYQLENPVSGNTFTATFELDNPDASYELWGYSAETVSDSNEWWGDYAPSEHAPWYSGGGDSTDNGDTSDKGIPGFEILIVTIAMALVIFLRRKKKL
ncbi:MAG: Heimdall-CTERM domain-containing surface protein [Candidatus Thermoplasmatota archaeon]